MPERNIKDMPYVSNYPALEEWLEKHDGRCMWQTTSNRREHSINNSSIEGWLIHDVIVVIEVHSRGHGWNIFTACRDSKIDATFADAEARIGISRSWLEHLDPPKP